VVQRLSYVSQAHQLQTLEKLAQKNGPHLGPTRRLEEALAFLEDKKEELPYFYPDLFDKCANLWEQIRAYPYFKGLAARPQPPETPFRRRVWQMLLRGQELTRELGEQHRQVHAAADRGTPFPVLTSKK
jgi:hypothetical protein